MTLTCFFCLNQNVKWMQFLFLGKVRVRSIPDIGSLYSLLRTDLNSISTPFFPSSKLWKSEKNLDTATSNSTELTFFPLSILVEVIIVIVTGGKQSQLSNKLFLSVRKGKDKILMICFMLTINQTTHFYYPKVKRWQWWMFDNIVCPRKVFRPDKYGNREMRKTKTSLCWIWKE